MKVLVLATAALVVIPSMGLAQDAPTRLLGRVLGPDGRSPVVGASVKLNNASAVTDQRGQFSISPAPSGRHLVQFEMLGYQPRADSVTLPDGETVELEVRLAQKAIELPPVTVTVRSQWLGENGFYTRKTEVPGRFITRTEIDKKNPTGLTDLFHDVSGAKVHRIGIGKTEIRFNRTQLGEMGSLPPKLRRIPGCQPLVYLDGRPHYDRLEGGFKLVDDFNIVNPAIIEAIEIYVGNTPIEFRGEGCGAIVIWTRRGR
jgi:hypothetical protein